MLRNLLVAIFALTAALLAACGPSAKHSNDPKPVTQCKIGDSKPADDGCNSCSCAQDGSWACTELGCPDDGEAPTAQLCTAGDSKQDDDGCNTCSCNEMGQWLCTEMFCE